MRMQVLFAGVPVARFADALDWYSRLFGRPADVVAHATEVMWQVTESGWLYIVQDSDRAGGALAAVAVPDLDEALRDLAARGIAGAPVERVGDAGRKATLSDPDGNAVALIQVPPA